MTTRAVETAALSGLALVLTVAMSFPVLQAPSERIFGTEIVGRHHDPFTVMEQFGRPVRLDSHSQPLTDLPGALLARFSNPVAAYNWIVLLTFPLSAAAAFLLARQLGLSRAPSAFVALAFAFSPFHVAQAAYHPHIAQTQWIPLYFLALWRCLDDGTPAAAALLALSVAAVTLSSFYGGLIAAVLTPVAAGAYWLFISRRPSGSFRSVAVTIGTLCGTALALVLVTWPVARGADLAAFPRADLFRYSAKWWGYLVPPVAHPLLGSVGRSVWQRADVSEGLLEQQVSLGWGVVALAVVAVAAWLRRPARSTALAAVPVAAAVAAVALLCSLSPERQIGALTFTRPAAILYPVLPMFRSYARFGVVVQLMAALLAAFGAQHLWRAGPRAARLACVALLALAGAEYAVWPPSLWRDVLPTQGHRWIARQRGAIRAMDCTPMTTESRSVQWLSAARIVPQVDPFDDCTQPNLADKLIASGYTHVLVRRHTPDGRWFARQPVPRGLQPVARFRDSEVFVVAQQDVPVYTDTMLAFYRRESDARRSWRWMGSDAAWTVMSTADHPVDARLDVEIASFGRARDLKIRLDGGALRTVTIEPARRVHRIGPFRLMPGGHTLVFESADQADVADAVVHNADPRALSFAFGEWHWLIDGGRP